MFYILHYVIAFCFIFTLQIRNLISSLVKNLCNALRINKSTSTKLLLLFLRIKDFFKLSGNVVLLKAMWNMCGTYAIRIQPFEYRNFFEQELWLQIV